MRQGHESGDAEGPEGRQGASYAWHRALALRRLAWTRAPALSRCQGSASFPATTPARLWDPRRSPLRPARPLRRQKPLDGGSENSGVSVDFGPTLSDAKEEKAATFELKYLVREVDILMQLDHPAIVHMHEYFVSKSGSKIYIVLQYLGAPLGPPPRLPPTFLFPTPTGSARPPCAARRPAYPGDWRPDPARLRAPRHAQRSATDSDFARVISRPPSLQLAASF